MNNSTKGSAVELVIEHPLCHDAGMSTGTQSAVYLVSHDANGAALIWQCFVAADGLKDAILAHLRAGRLVRVVGRAGRRVRASDCEGLTPGRR